MLKVCSLFLYMRRRMGKPTICLGENKGADQLHGYHLCFLYSDSTCVQFLFYLNLKFQASSSFLCLYRPVCVGPGRKPHCLFFHVAAHILMAEFLANHDDQNLNSSSSPEGCMISPFTNIGYDSQSFKCLIT